MKRNLCFKNLNAMLGNSQAHNEPSLKQWSHEWGLGSEGGPGKRTPARCSSINHDPTVLAADISEVDPLLILQRGQVYVLVSIQLV